MILQQKYSPGFFGLKQTNRDFSKPDSWGKNQFNTAFPASLGCYMHDRGIKPVYLTLNDRLRVNQSMIDIPTVYGLDPFSEKTLYCFETNYTRYQHLVYGDLPKIDLVIAQEHDGQTSHIRGIEIKLTALPDNSTCSEPEDSYGCEIVIRPDTILYLALSIVLKFQEQPQLIKETMSPYIGELSNNEWEDPDVMINKSEDIINSIDAILWKTLQQQEPFLIQPVWKTYGKKLILHHDCLDMFVWSDYALTRLFVDASLKSPTYTKSGDKNITRYYRAVIWLARMLFDFSTNYKISQDNILNVPYNTKNDKAFSITGKATRNYIQSEQIKTPRIKRDEVKNIILNGAQNFLSPERRLDAAILTTFSAFWN
jgi:hypothetical protein